MVACGGANSSSSSSKPGGWKDTVAVSGELRQALSVKKSGLKSKSAKSLKLEDEADAADESPAAAPAADIAEVDDDPAKDATEDAAAQSEGDVMEEEYAKKCVTLKFVKEDGEDGKEFDMLVEETESTSAECVALAKKIEDFEKKNGSGGADEEKDDDVSDSIMEEAIEVQEAELSSLEKETTTECTADEASEACVKAESKLETEIESLGVEVED
jgi:hypothetical protein